MKRVLQLTFVVALVWLTACSNSYGAKKLSIGDDAPQWNSIIGIDGKDHSLAQYKAAKAIVVVFTCNHCPVAKAYEDRIIALQNDYQARGVQVIAINVNTMPADRLDKMKERAEQKGFNFPYLYDATQVSAREYGATKTPQFYLLDQKRKLAYTGALDDNQDKSSVKESFLRDAIDAVLAGRTPAVAETKAVGCGIKFD